MRAAALIVVLGLVAFASGIKIFDQNEALTLACCGSNSYDTTTHFCCIDNIFRNDDSDTNLCCGRNRLGNDKQCCSAIDGVVSVNDKQISSSQTCCGTTGYDPSNQLCCAPNHVLNNRDGNLQCCGSDRTYDPSRDLCCSTVRIRDRGNCEDAEVDVNFNVISNGANDGKQCCGNSAFNPSTQLCCGGTDDARVVSNGDNNLQCCGSSSYDPSRQTCCQVESSQDFTVDGQTVTVTFTRGKVAGNANLQCCDDGSLNAFDPATQICCAGTVQKQNSDNSLACCGSRTFNTLTQTCCSREVARFKRVKGCCGGCDTFVAVTETEFNIGSPANAQCCDNRPFDDTKNICCKDNIIRQNDDNSLQCCGRDAFNTNRDICCTDESEEHGQVFRDRLDDDVTFECCLNIDASDECNIRYNFDIFDTAKKSCPCGKVIDQKDDLSLNNNNPDVQAGCCGTTQIDVNSKTCCSKAIHDVDPAIGLKCCADDGKTLYNPGYQVCCGGKSSGCSVPCGAKKIREVEETEESEEDKKKKKKKSDNRSKVQCGDSCCGKEGYFAAYQKCCDGKILDFNSAADGSSPMTCCGDEIYNTNFRNCCIDTRIKSVGRCGIDATTDHAIFDADTQICCGSGVVTFA